MFGWIVAGHQIGVATAALGAGTLRTVLGTYAQAFLMAGALCIVAALLALRIAMPTRGRRQMAAAPAYSRREVWLGSAVSSSRAWAAGWRSTCSAAD